MVDRRGGPIVDSWFMLGAKASTEVGRIKSGSTTAREKGRDEHGSVTGLEGRPH